MGLTLTDDQILDITGHLWCDEFVWAIEKFAPDDWHCVYWNRDAANTGETYNLGTSEAAALAIVQQHAESESDEIDNVERTDDGLTVWAQDEVYARIKRAEFAEPDDGTRKRLGTLIAPLKTWDLQGLAAALATLPAWLVEPHNFYPIWFDGHIPWQEPSRGEWLPPLSSDHYSLTTAERRALLSQVLLPMWATPNSLAKILQQLLVEHAPGRRPMLAQCQEGLAQALGLASWQVLVARFRSFISPQVAQQFVNDDCVPQVRIWRGPIDMLASVYDYAVERKRSGASPLCVQAKWLDGYRMALTYRCISRADLLREVSAIAGRHPAEFDDPSEMHTLAERRWDAAEQACRVRNEEWSDHGYSGDIIEPDDEAVSTAQAELNGL